jgi:MFS family permease
MKVEALARSFRLLICTQFLTVFNDNAFKQVVLLMALAANDLGGDPQARAGLVFALPFLLFLVLAGDIADRVSKRHLLVVTKWVEAGVMALASYALWLGNLNLGLVALFLMGTQSAFLGPAKYGIVPELVDNTKIARANGFLQASVMVGILLGTGAAGLFRTVLGEELWIAGVVFTMIAIVGALVAMRIDTIPAADPGRIIRFNPFGRFRDSIRLARVTPGLFPAMIGHGIFWLVGGLGLFAWNEVGIRDLKVHEGWWTAGLASLSLSIGVGSLVAGYLCRERPRPSFTTRGAAAMAIGYLAIALGPHDPWFIWSCSLLSNFFMGFYLIPLKSIIQQIPAATDKGRLQGASQMIDWIFIVAASLVKEGLSRINVGGTDTFLVMSGLMAATAIGMRMLRPLAKLRLPAD